MPMITALRLFGFLSGRSRSDREILEAGRNCARELGLREPHSGEDPELLQQLAPILRVRGLLAARSRERVPGNSHQGQITVAGILGCREQQAADSVWVGHVDLRGTAKRTLATAKLTSNGQFWVSFRHVSDKIPLICIEIRRGRKLLFRSSTEMAQPEVWFEWSDDGAPLPFPGLFELREARLQAVLRKAGHSFDEAVRTGNGATISALASMSGLRPHLVKHHLFAARLAAKGLLDVPSDVVGALLGPASTNGGAAPLRDESGEPPMTHTAATEDHRVGRALDIDAEEIQAYRARILAAGPDVVRYAITRAIASRELSAVREQEVDIFTRKLSESRARLTPAPRSREDRRAFEVLGNFGLNREHLDGAAERVAKVLKTVSPRAAARMADDELGGLLGRSGLSAAEVARVLAILRKQEDRLQPGDALVRRRFSKLDPATRDFLSTRGDGFDLTGDLVDAALPTNESGSPSSNGARQRVREELLSLQRVVRVAKDGEVASVLLDKRYDSAQRIAVMDAESFASELGRVSVPREVALRVHRRARAHYRAAVELYLRFNANANGPAGAMLRDRVDVAGTDSIPTYQYLFGSQDYAAVEDWESIISQSAYFVDLLVWLSEAPRSTDPAILHPYDVLVARRPDLVGILLNEANATTLVPHIDLACELLEDAIRRRRAPGTPLPVRQTTRTAEELRAYPEHVDVDIYGDLRTSVRSMALPFDLWLEETRSYLQLKTWAGTKLTRLHLADLFSPGLFERAQGLPTSAARDHAAEVLGINQVEFDTISRPDPSKAAQEAIWGTSSMENVGAFLDRAPDPARPRGRLSYDQTLGLIATQFVDPDGVVNIRLAEGVTVDRGRAEERVFSPPLDEKFLDRIHRFLRLSRRVPCSLAELDLLISAAGGTLDDAAALVGIAGLLRCRLRLGLEFEETAALFRDFREEDARPSPRPDGTIPLYRRLFLLRSDGEEIPEAFLKNGGPAIPLDSQSRRICAALSISPDEFAALLAATGLTGKNVSFQNLSILFRHVQLARALGQQSREERTLSQFLSMLEILGSPFEKIESLPRFLDDLALVDAAGLTAGDVMCLSGRNSPALPDVTVLDEALHDLRTATREALRKSTGRPPNEEDVTKEIVDQRTWAPPVSAWLGLDARLSTIVSALPKAVAKVILDPDSETRPAALARTARLARTIVALRISSAEAVHVTRIPGFLDLSHDPTWRALAELIDRIALGRQSNFPAFCTYAAEVSSSDPLPAAARKLAPVFGLDPEAVEAIWRSLDKSDPPPAILDAAFLRRIYDVAALDRTLGVPAEVLKAWGTTWPDAGQAGDVRDAVRATLPSGAWLDLSAKCQNALRGPRRDALVEFLLSLPPGETPDPALPDAKTIGDVSANLLLDVEMEACRDTTRIIQAISAVQMLVHRCLLGLESEIVSDAMAAEASRFWREWDWRKQYRLWEVNRSIFLYPENFLSVGNRASASTLFKQFQKKTAEGEINEANVASALEGYLIGLEQKSRLEYESVASGGGNEAPPVTLGMLARTNGISPVHYYRRFFGGTWTPWEEVPLGASPRNLSLGQRTSRAVVAWPTVEHHLHPDQPIPEADPRETPLNLANHGGKSLSYVRYSWTIRDDRGIWSPVKTTTRALVLSPRDLRTLVVNANPRDPGVQAFSVMLLTPDPKHVSEAEPAISVHRVGLMQVGGDTVRSQLNAGFTGLPEEDLKTPAWRAHYQEYRLSSQTTHELVISPWPKFHFDSNRMVSDEVADDAELAVPVSAPEGVTFVTLLKAPGPLWATKSTRTESPLPGDNQPKAEAFVVSGALKDSSNLSWRLLLLSPVGQQEILPESVRGKLNVPAGNFLAVPAYHPFAGDLVTLLRRTGLKSIFNAELQERPSMATVGREPLAYRRGTPSDQGPRLDLAAENVCVLSDGAVVPKEGPDEPRENFDFDRLAPYGLYNYETFFYAPLFVALKLGAARRFREAQAFFHFIFNPLSVEPGNSSKRFWVTKPFRLLSEIKDVQQVLELAAAKPRGSDSPNPWQVILDHPFDPHAVADVRPSARQKYVVGCYLENLVEWGDDLYRRGTREDVDQATTVYELAQTILGDPPRKLRQLGRRPERAFVRPEDWLGGNNILVELEALVRDAGEDGTDVPAVHLPLILRDETVRDKPGPKALFFRVPPNEKLVSLWEMVARRLSNIRMCRSIDGASVALPLTAAPIDPRVLADAAALGISVADAIAMAKADPPPFRFRVMLAKAVEYCHDVRNLAAALLSALEKRDGEQLALVRSRFEEPVLAARRLFRTKQLEQANAERTALNGAREVVKNRKLFFESRPYMNDLENDQLDLSRTALIFDDITRVLEQTASSARTMPDGTYGAAGMGGTPVSTVNVGGSTAAAIISYAAQATSRLASLHDRLSAITGIQAGYARRKDDWGHQAEQARLELAHLDQQIAAADLRVAIMKADLQGQDAEDNSWNQLDRLMREKFTSVDLFDWHVGRLTELHRRAYEQALELATLARACLEFETGNAELPKAPVDAWKTQVSGLTSGEALSQHLKDLELVHLAFRPYARVVTQHVSLRYVAPAALRQLIATRTTGDFTIPAWWWKRLYPGVQKRRVRSLYVSIPCVGGPFASVNATVRYTGTKRIAVKSISLSTGVADYGWDMTTREDRYVPFEGLGLDEDTTWAVDFPPGSDVDTTTISDVVFHVEYGADEGADGAEVPPRLDVFVDVATMVPDAWAKLVEPSGAHSCTFDPSKLLPSFLDGYEAREIKFPTLLDKQGSTHADMLECTLVPVPPEQSMSVKIAGLPGAPDRWADLRHLLIVLEVQKPS